MEQPAEGGCRLQRSSKSQAPNQGPSDVVAIQDGALKFGPWNFSDSADVGVSIASVYMAKSRVARLVRKEVERLARGKTC
jgi:hypothetical protein